MDLQVAISIADELSDSIIKSTGSLDLASGEIRAVKYEDYDVEAEGLPADREDYEFTSGTLSNNGKDVEFGVNVYGGKYSVSANELLEIKVRAAKLFAGIDGKTLAASAPTGEAPAKVARPRGGKPKSR